MWSFRWRLTWMIFLILLSTAGLFFVLNYQIERQVITEQLRKHALLLGKTVQHNLLRLLSAMELHDLSDLSDTQRRELGEFIRHISRDETQVDLYGEHDGIHDLFLIDTQETVLVDAPREREGRTLPGDERLDPAAVDRMRHGQMDTRLLQRGRNSFLLLTFPLFQREQLLGYGRLEVAVNPTVVILERLRLWSLIATGGLLLVSLVVASYLARSITRPIGELVDAAVRIGRGDFSHRLDASRRDEMGVLMAAFNRMTEGILKLEETLQRVQKLEVASRLGALVAHEIRNPLNSIGLIVDHLKDRLAAANHPERGKFLKMAENLKLEITRLNRIVEGFLSSAKPLTISKQPADLNRLLDETLASAAPAAERQRITLHRHYDANLPSIAVDYQQMHQALLNLLINALQAMPDGGELHLRTSLHRNEGQEAVLSIQDTGCGIPAENLPHLFDHFFTTKERGYGLGLPIVERIVQEHGGRIDVISQIGKGSMFTIYLPLDHGGVACQASTAS